VRAEVPDGQEGDAARPPVRLDDRAARVARRGLAPPVGERDPRGVPEEHRLDVVAACEEGVDAVHAPEAGEDGVLPRGERREVDEDRPGAARDAPAADADGDARVAAALLEALVARLGLERAAPVP